VHDDTNLLSSAVSYRALDTAVVQMTVVGITSTPLDLLPQVKQIAARVTGSCATIQ
jgi:hypothetical protein